MSSSNTTQDILDPETPLAFLSPEAAYQTSVSLYVLAGSLAVLCWDILDNITNDYKLLFKNRISLTTTVYFVSRIGSLVYVMSGTIFETAPTSANCRVFDHAANAFSAISTSFSTLLFFFRIRAVYNRNPKTVLFFVVFWLILVGATITGPVAVVGGNIGHTTYCEDAVVPNYAFTAIFVPVVYDTLVFCAISWRLAQNAHVEMGSVRGGIKVALLGKYLPLFTKSLLKDGQKYYLLTSISAFLTIVVAVNTSVPVPLRTVFATPTLVLTNIMACRVYRNTRFGLFRENEISTANMMGELPPFPVFAHTRTTTVGNAVETRNRDGLSMSVNIPNLSATVSSPGSASELKAEAEGGLRVEEYTRSEKSEDVEERAKDVEKE